MSYTFVLKDKGTLNQGWWLKLSNINEVADYFETKFTDMMEDGFHSLHTSKEFGHGMEHANAVAWVLGLMSQNLGIPATEVATRISTITLSNMIDAVFENKSVFVNRCGGYHIGGEYSDWMHKPTCKFPEFDKKQIHVTQFPGGTHYYARIDGIEVRDGDKIKWDTYEEAYEYAMTLIKKG